MGEEAKQPDAASSGPTRNRSRWLVGTLSGKDNHLTEIEIVRGSTAESAAKTYIDMEERNPDLPIRVWPLRAHGVATDFKTTTVQVATAV